MCQSKWVMFMDMCALNHMDNGLTFVTRDHQMPHKSIFPSYFNITTLINWPTFIYNVCTINNFNFQYFSWWSKSFSWSVFYLISYGITNLHYFLTYWDMYGPHHNQQEKTMWNSNLTLNPINIATMHNMVCFLTMWTHNLCLLKHLHNQC